MRCETVNLEEIKHNPTRSSSRVSFSIIYHFSLDFGETSDARRQTAAQNLELLSLTFSGKVTDRETRGFSNGSKLSCSLHW